MMATQNLPPPRGSEFWDTLCGPQKGKYPEYVSPDLWFGEYVAKMEQDSHASAGSAQGKGSLSGGATSEAKSPPAKLPRWKRRTPEQIEANKAAQKRFRERKKAKQQNTASQVDELSQRVQDFEGLNADVQALEERNLTIESELWAKEAEINRIKVEMLDQKTPQAAYDSKAQASCLTGVFSSPPTLDVRIDKVAQQWQKERDLLERQLQLKGLEPSQKPDVHPKQLKELEKRCLAVMIQCMEIMNLGGPQLDDLLRTVNDREEDLMRQGATAKYADIARWLCLSDEQVQLILGCRADVLSRLERIYMDRQGLNMQVMAMLMTPQSQPAENGPRSTANPSDRAAELRSALNTLQQNLREEQRLESEHHHAIFRKILTPLQGAWFICKAYPQHCDTLAFMHGVHELHRQSGTSDRSSANNQ